MIGLCSPHKPSRPVSIAVSDTGSHCGNSVCVVDLKDKPSLSSIMATSIVPQYHNTWVWSYFSLYDYNLPDSLYRSNTCWQFFFNIALLWKTVHVSVDNLFGNCLVYSLVFMVPFVMYGNGPRSPFVGFELTDQDELYSSYGSLLFGWETWFWIWMTLLWREWEVKMQVPCNILFFLLSFHVICLVHIGQNWTDKLCVFFS